MTLSDGTAAIGPDDLERWCEARDRREDQSVSAQYVPREMTGYQDLDDYGSWQGAREATDRYFDEHGKRPLLDRIDEAARIAIKL